MELEGDKPKIIDCSHGQFKVTYATNQSYVHLNGVFVIAISSKMAEQAGQHHHETMAQLVQCLVKMPEVSKESAKEARTTLLG
jgi:hypothetical protein